MKNVKGLTLIEVLIALAIIGIALTAVVKATGQNIRATNYLQDKTVATWVGTQVMNEARLGVIKIPENDQMHQAKNMLNRDWYFRVKQEETPNKRIKKITVNVYPNEDDDEADSIVTLSSYVYAQE